MITRCPECSTLFKVVADQLKISDGWVRCGRCDHVFDGAANLQDDSVAETTVATPPRLPPSSKRDDTVPADSRGAPPTAASGAAQGSEGPTPRSLPPLMLQPRARAPSTSSYCATRSARRSTRDTCPFGPKA